MLKYRNILNLLVKQICPFLRSSVPSLFLIHSVVLTISLDEIQKLFRTVVIVIIFDIVECGSNDMSSLHVFQVVAFWRFDFSIFLKSMSLFVKDNLLQI